MFLEGEELGVQTGFQRFLVVGQLRGLVKIWLSRVEEFSDSKINNDKLKFRPRVNQKLLKSLQEIHMTLESLFENDLVRTTNSDTNVSEYEKILKKTTAKLLPISYTLGENEFYKSTFSFSKQIAGEIPTASMTGAESDIW